MENFIEDNKWKDVKVMLNGEETANKSKLYYRDTRKNPLTLFSALEYCVSEYMYHNNGRKPLVALSSIENVNILENYLIQTGVGSNDRTGLKITALDIQGVKIHRTVDMLEAEFVCY